MALPSLFVAEVYNLGCFDIAYKSTDMRMRLQSHGIPGGTGDEIKVIFLPNVMVVIMVVINLLIE